MTAKTHFTIKKHSSAKAGRQANYFSGTTKGTTEL